MSTEQKARPEGQGELRDEARERRTQQLLRERESMIVEHVRLTRVGEIREVKVGRKVVPMVEAVRVIQIRFVQERASPSATTTPLGGKRRILDCKRNGGKGRRTWRSRKPQGERTCPR